MISIILFVLTLPQQNIQPKKNHDKTVGKLLHNAHIVFKDQTNRIRYKLIEIKGAIHMNAKTPNEAKLFSLNSNSLTSF